MYHRRELGNLLMEACDGSLDLLEKGLQQQAFWEAYPRKLGNSIATGYQVK